LILLAVIVRGADTAAPRTRTAIPGLLALSLGTIGQFAATMRCSNTDHDVRRVLRDVPQLPDQTTTEPAAASLMGAGGMTEISVRAGARRLPAHGVSFGEALRVWLRSRGDVIRRPAGQIAVMHRIIVDEKKWVAESRFLHALSYCMLLPGPEAQQLATYIGWLMHRWPGAIAAGGLFVVPGIIAIMVLSWVYAAFGQSRSSPPCSSG